MLEMRYELHKYDVHFINDVKKFCHDAVDYS